MWGVSRWEMSSGVLSDGWEERIGQWGEISEFAGKENDISLREESFGLG